MCMPSIDVLIHKLCFIVHISDCYMYMILLCYIHMLVSLYLNFFPTRIIGSCPGCPTSTIACIYSAGPRPNIEVVQLPCN
jgi:hypothetical protein